MDALKIRKGGGNGPEHSIQLKIIEMLEMHQWYVIVIPGSAQLTGMPDLYATHKGHGFRWIEVKDPRRKGEVFEKSQLENFPKMSRNGSPIYVLTGATYNDYRILMGSENWWTYLSVMRGLRPKGF